ncbi:MAG TPA: acyl-CoA dehydrogenase family protein [Mycobacteriales bacterium]|jgi:alkylation response protein AidB-like acyl-CoA dehydrogenase|nr:acyl-CoA dehydrogenase family protein [Mycobacteriales bacterium]HVX70933.1 acyl-CoA dehydrogenase family protein [Mycobacteriales bacterium]
MDLLLSDDQRSIVAAVTELLDDLMPIEAVRRVLDGDNAPLDALWRSAGELGWFGLGLAEEHGGTGFDLIDEALLFVELGRRIVPGPFLATILAARIAALGGAADAAMALLAGQARAGLAARPDNGPAVLYDAADATYLVVFGSQEVELLPAAMASGRTDQPGLDPLTRRETANLFGEPIVSAPREEPIVARGSVLVSAMLTGIAAATRDLSVDYAKTREQFGSAIGAFQAIKHRCADMAVGAALAEAQLTFAALSVTEGTEDARFQAAAARVVAEHAALSNAREAIQIYGGIGVTWECDAHLYLKRVHALRELFGGEAAHRPALLDRHPRD